MTVAKPKLGPRILRMISRRQPRISMDAQNASIRSRISLSPTAAAGEGVGGVSLKSSSAET